MHTGVLKHAVRVDGFNHR